ncbi:PREDICTED: myosin light chain kinase, smooth muscle-like [Ceratosolen solmsi marchali]|uniref:Myosin light chain kinase, smooth muscle-like n=1 Tax=Ceratosolen solmsi marchali TaxID=326594 RepID=A0AAJ7DTF9_9HYME|nr:PREDICTED: myosin light chain kinase, smooth muscle-like [Ceratosolen solmsi marchali]
MEDGLPQFTMRLRDRRVQTSYPVRLTCQVFGCPEPEVSWLKDGKFLTETPTRSIHTDESHFYTLEIERASLDDCGCYTACAKNANGSISCRCVLVVDKGIRAYVAPRFHYELEVAHAVKVDGDLRLRTQIEAYPSVGVVWHRDGIRLRPRRTATMTLSHDGIAELILAKVRNRDAGIYTCTATNEVGKVETSTKVCVIGADDSINIADNDAILQVNINPPDIDIPYSKVPLFVTKPLSTEAQEGDTIIIQCEVVADPKPEVIWLRDFLKPDYYRDAVHFRCIGAGPQYRLEIPHAKLDYTGTYSVLAKNEHGEAKAVISLQIYAKGQGRSDSMDQMNVKRGIDSGSGFRRKPKICPPKFYSIPHNRVAEEGETVRFQCAVAGHPMPWCVWDKNGIGITSNTRISLKEKDDVRILEIAGVTLEDIGLYRVTLENDIGRTEATARLEIISE